jgi:hypothetical protein
MWMSSHEFVLTASCVSYKHMQCSGGDHPGDSSRQGMPCICGEMLNSNSFTLWSGVHCSRCVITVTKGAVSCWLPTSGLAKRWLSALVLFGTAWTTWPGLYHNYRLFTVQTCVLCVCAAPLDVEQDGPELQGPHSHAGGHTPLRVARQPRQRDSVPVRARRDQVGCLRWVVCSCCPLLSGHSGVCWLLCMMIR